MDFTGTCTPTTPCGGAPDGTYDYVSGCLGDVFKDARAACAGLDVSGAKTTVRGSVYFSGAKLARDAVVTISGSIKFPQSCTQGQCALIEQQLKSSFKTITCTGTSDCDCAVTQTDTTKNETTFTVSGNNITTGDGETYAFCIKGAEFAYKGKSAGSEDGDWVMKKR